jgi:hypothetical protein
MIPMAVSMELAQQWVKVWAVDVDPEVEVQVLSPHDDPREKGDIIPVRLSRHGYQMTVGFPESCFPGSPLPEATCRTLAQVVRLLGYMEARGLRQA